MRIHLLANGWHHAGGVGDAHGGLTTWRYVQTIAFLLEVVHLALTCLGKLSGVDRVLQVKVVALEAILHPVEGLLLGHVHDVQRALFAAAIASLPTEVLLF